LHRRNVNAVFNQRSEQCFARVIATERAHERSARSGSGRSDRLINPFAAASFKKVRTRNCLSWFW
jgi:hypothetical protein